jgi:hypothetical protein
MNIDTAMFMRQEKIRRFPNSVLAKQDRFFKDSKKRAILFGLQEEKHWSSFAASVCNQFDKFGSLTEGQLFAAKNFLGDLEKKRFPMDVVVDLEDDLSDNEEYGIYSEFAMEGLK